MDFKALYFYLFAACADATAQLDAQNYGLARDILIRAQQTAEQAYLDADERTDTSE